MPRSGLIGCWLFVATAAAQDRPPQLAMDLPVSVELRTASRGPVSLLAPALATHGISAGIVRRRADENVESLITDTADTAGPVTLGRVLTMFQRAHPLYLASISSNVVRIRPTETTSCDAALGATIPSTQVAGTDVSVVSQLMELVVAATNRQRKLGGAVGSTLSRPGEPAQIPDPPLVSIRVGPSSLADALDAIVLATKGAVWMAVEGPGANGRTNCYMTLFRANGTSVVFGTDLSGL